MGDHAKQQNLWERILDFGASVSTDWKWDAGILNLREDDSEKKIGCTPEQQNRVCWSLPAQSMGERGEEGSKAPPQGAAVLAGDFAWAPWPVVQPSSSLGPV